MNSYSSAARPELSDYTKAYLNSLTTNTNTTTTTTRPELSNLTKEYLSSYTTNLGGNEEKEKEKNE